MPEKTRTIVAEYIDRGMGFPVTLRNVPMVRVFGDWAADIDYVRLHRTTALALAFKPGRLTGAEVRFLRLFWELTYQKFADLFAVRAQTVMKWEKADQSPTRMAWTTEKDLRLTVLDRLGVDKAEFMDAFRLLRDEQPSPSAFPPHAIDLKRRPSARSMAKRLRTQLSAQA